GRGARLLVDLERVDGAPAGGRLALSVLSGWPDFGPGERVAFSARLHLAHGTRNFGLPDPELALRSAGIGLLAAVASPAAIDRAVGGAAGGFLRTAVLGDRRGVGDDVEAGFRAAGATHVLSVSGLHLAAVVALVFLAVRWAAGLVPALPLYVDPRAVAAA